MVWIELRFPVIGTALPSDHGYAMYSAISKVVPEAHQADWLAVETVPGTARGDGGIHINERARLRMRMPQDRLPLMLKLAGKRVDVDGYALRARRTYRSPVVATVSTVFQSALRAAREANIGISRRT